MNGIPTVVATNKVKIETIVGNKFKPAYFEINGTHLIGMLRFFAQMTGAKDITEDQFQKFENMEISAEKLPENPPKEAS